MRRPATFDVTADLPDHTTVLEASAGTGKTYAIVGLAARHIAEGVPISEMLLVTFSRAATAELRERMRDRVRELLDGLDRPGAAPGHDALLQMLAQGAPDEVATRRRNLARALSDFDASTIATTHTFCNRMLEALGFLGERELVYSIVEEVDELTEEVALTSTCAVSGQATHRNSTSPRRSRSPATRYARRRSHWRRTPPSRPTGRVAMRWPPVG